ncbi:MAG: cation-translocating P-type ATPase, partial [Brevundimonas sp.]|nr:cation-translocating P-type ATPase [Brevundimonas sp.]
MGDQSGRSLPTLADQAEARTIVPAAPNCEDGSGHAPVDAGHDRDHHDHDHDHDDDGHDHEHPFEWPEAIRIGFVAVTAALVWFRIWEPLEAISLIGVVGLLVGGWPILKEAFENVLQRRMTMELSMTIAIVAAAAIGEFFTALIITLFVLVAEVLEGMTVGRGRKAIRDLLEFLPREVSVRRTGAIRTISAEELSIGDAILVAPGGRIPVDGGV